LRQDSQDKPKTAARLQTTTNQDAANQDKPLFSVAKPEDVEEPGQDASEELPASQDALLYGAALFRK
jgi:hypothetical protein